MEWIAIGFGANIAKCDELIVEPSRIATATIGKEGASPVIDFWLDKDVYQLIGKWYWKSNLNFLDPFEHKMSPLVLPITDHGRVSAEIASGAPDGTKKNNAYDSISVVKCRFAFLASALDYIPW